MECVLRVSRFQFHKDDRNREGTVLGFSTIGFGPIYFCNETSLGKVMEGFGSFLVAVNTLVLPLNLVAEEIH